MEINKCKWRSPSNIAIVKYWGKKGPQLPANPSISFTLDNVATEMTLELRPKTLDNDIELHFLFEGKPKPAFEPKLLQLLNKACPEMKWIGEYALHLSSTNNFPYGTGIASSASSMSALALCMVDMNRHINKLEMSDDLFYEQASFWSRIGSGSACRSVYGGFVSWGEDTHLPNSSDYFATPLKSIHPVFKGIKDVILVVDGEEKAVSSTKGHGLLNEHPYAKARFEQAFVNTSLLIKALKEGDLAAFGKIAEQEALALHAMMLTSDPGFFLFKPNTIKVLDKINEFKNKTGIQLFFTMDAGPNVHLLYFEDNETQVLEWIAKELVVYCAKEQYICSGLGNGPLKLS
jgi:diphosphomevalonate decarboxylase